MSLTGLSLWSNKDSLNKHAFVYLKDILVIFFPPSLSSGTLSLWSWMLLVEYDHNTLSSASNRLTTLQLVFGYQLPLWNCKGRASIGKSNDATMPRDFFPFLYLFYFIFGCPVLFIYVFKRYHIPLLFYFFIFFGLIKWVRFFLSCCISVSVCLYVSNTFVQCGNTIITQVINSSSSGSSSNKT